MRNAEITTPKKGEKMGKHFRYLMSYWMSATDAPVNVPAPLRKALDGAWLMIFITIITIINLEFWPVFLHLCIFAFRHGVRNIFRSLFPLLAVDTHAYRISAFPPFRVTHK